MKIEAPEDTGVFEDRSELFEILIDVYRSKHNVLSGVAKELLRSAMIEHNNSTDLYHKASIVVQSYVQDTVR